MSRSERLYKMGIVEAVIFGIPVSCKITKIENLPRNTRYIGTDFETFCNGKETSVDVYENESSEFYGII